MKIRLYGSVFVLALLVCAPALGGHRFHATAFAVGGEDREAVASVALPAAGGASESVVRDFNDGLVRFAEAHSFVRGYKEGAVAITTTEMTILDLTIADRVHVDRLVARTNSRQSVDEAEAAINFDGSVLQGLTIDGQRIDVMLDTAWFAEHPTFASVRAAGFEPLNSMPGVTCSAYEHAACNEGRNGIRIGGLGVLTIGSVHVKNGTRSLEMLRLDSIASRPGRVRTLEDPPPVVVGGVEGNGSPLYP